MCSVIPFRSEIAVGIINQNGGGLCRKKSPHTVKEVAHAGKGRRFVEINQLIFSKCAKMASQYIRIHGTFFKKIISQRSAMITVG